MEEAYSWKPHAQFSARGKMEDVPVVTDYEPLKFSSFRVFCACKGTVLQDPVIFIEQCIITIIFLSCAIPVYIYFNQDYGSDRKGSMDLNTWLAKQEPKMRAFAMIMTTLAAFLLSFYTSMAVGRWWMIRTAGVGGIKAATVELEMFICQFVTEEQQVLKSIRRYGRASLMLIFLWRREELKEEQLREQLGPTGRDLLTDGEIDSLMKWNHCLHESIWAWQASIVTMLHKEGKIKSDHILELLYQRCSDGRAAVQLVHTHLAVRIPMQYVHLLGMLVKMHNAVLAVIMGILFGGALRNLEGIICAQLFGRTLILPFLFNAILLINSELSDPFNGATTDFPCSTYEAALEKDGRAMCEATKNLPNWLQSRYRPPP